MCRGFLCFLSFVDLSLFACENGVRIRRNIVKKRKPRNDKSKKKVLSLEPGGNNVKADRGE